MAGVLTGIIILVGVGVSYNLFDLRRRPLRTQKTLPGCRKRLDEQRTALALSINPVDVEYTALWFDKEIPNQLKAANAPVSSKAIAL
ncbi:hypothetical protein HK413_14320 [Mucilaginibacter sp. S1162]|uniref:Uncharacterized protein n=1 Tax=Mucilaginibacter humi TaxID=2732510 RepID=A0ABX1W7F0_9SPHI|nr:hypothetical protein [Mucilaginibacter humi]NNU34921.1 hypothetical protein [Mucilaginibacter humi]